MTEFTFRPVSLIDLKNEKNISSFQLFHQTLGSIWILPCQNIISDENKYRIHFAISLELETNWIKLYLSGD